MSCVWRRFGVSLLLGNVSCHSGMIRVLCLSCNSSDTPSNIKLKSPFMLTPVLHKTWQLWSKYIWFQWWQVWTWVWKSWKSTAFLLLRQNHGKCLGGSELFTDGQQVFTDGQRGTASCWGDYLSGVCGHFDNSLWNCEILASLEYMPSNIAAPMGQGISLLKMECVKHCLQ